MISPPALVTACLNACLCALLIQIVSVCIPGWRIIAYENPNIKLVRNYAVWYMIECLTVKEYVFFKEHCSTDSYQTKLNSERHERLQSSMFVYNVTSSSIVRVEILTTLGIVCLITAVAVLVRLRQLNLKAFNNPAQTQPQELMFIVPGFFIGVSIILFIISFFTWEDPGHLGHGTSNEHYLAPYGMLLAVGSIVIDFCAAAIVLFMFFKRIKQQNQGTILSSGDYQSGATLPMMTSPPEMPLDQAPPPYQPPPSYHTYTTSPEYSTNTPRDIYAPQC